MLADDLAAVPLSAIPMIADELITAPQPFSPVLAFELVTVPQPAVQERALPRRGRGRPRRVTAVSLDFVEDLAAVILNFVEDLAAVHQHFVPVIARDSTKMQHPVELQIIDIAAVLQLGVPQPTSPRHGRGRSRRVADMRHNSIEI